MNADLHIHSAGPGVTVQDLGRPGWQAEGLSRGGAADAVALIEGAALLGSDGADAALEMMGFGGTFTVSQPTRIALTGAAMAATIDGAVIQWNASHVLWPNQQLQIGGARSGIYGYLSFAGGIATAPIMGSRATHLTAGIGRTMAAGDVLPLGADPNLTAPVLRLAQDARFAGGEIRVMPGPQSDLFTAGAIAAFQRTQFRRSARGNRQGVRLEYEGAGFAAEGQLNIVSDFIVPGDIQMTGDGVPFVLLAECQTIGGYPRIGTVIPADLPKVAQAMPGATLRFRFIPVAEADATAQPMRKQLQALYAACAPMIRSPHDIADLLSYQLISGVTPGDDLERP